MIYTIQEEISTDTSRKHIDYYLSCLEAFIKQPEAQLYFRTSAPVVGNIGMAVRLLNYPLVRLSPTRLSMMIIKPIQ